jgi:uncharacterized protein (TIGR02246 family)
MNVLRSAALPAMVLLATAACASGAADTSGELAAIKKDALVWFERFAAGDADGVAALYADDALFMPPGAPAVSGRAAIRDFVASDIANLKGAGLGMKADEVTDGGMSGDLAWVTGTFSVTDASGAAVDKGKYVTIYRKAGGKWPIIRDTYNSDQPPPAPPAAEKAAPSGS